MKKQNLKDRMRAWTQRHEKKALPHSLIALAIVLTIILTQPIWNGAPIPEDTRPDNVEHRISMVGDIMMGRHVQDAAEQSGEGMDRVFRYVTPYFQESDYVTGNLESPIIADHEEETKNMIEDFEFHKEIHLYAPVSAVDALVSAGFDSVSLANNHTMDYRELSFQETVRHMKGSGIEMVGIGHRLGDPQEFGQEEEEEEWFEEEPAQETPSSTQDEDIENEELDAARISYHDLDEDTTIAMIGITDVFYQQFAAGHSPGVFITSNVTGTGQAGTELLSRRLREARANADIVMVHIHWGEEYQIYRNRTDHQENLARFMSNNGADVVIGHHSHVLEDVEIIQGTIEEDGQRYRNNTLVMYSLGNFVFDQGWTRTKESVLAQLDLLDDGSSELSFIPMNVLDSAPRETQGLFKGYRDYRIFRTLRASLDDDLWRVDNSRLIIDLDAAGIFERGELVQ
ncbi:CapA family protein [Alteribacter keqinensis]|uniref:CapA family protein n=1 Tax=Alteribacter keqinensis TaxID=2483800 RepID=A0A3M7TTS5_9BACI|nr:CapA family protein [Alteribacter keqinensis]RNA67753.1 CapA family protein [Alteribacter keqinensis]